MHEFDSIEGFRLISDILTINRDIEHLLRSTRLNEQDIALLQTMLDERQQLCNLLGEWRFSREGESFIDVCKEDWSTALDSLAADDALILVQLQEHLNGLATEIRSKTQNKSLLLYQGI